MIPAWFPKMSDNLRAREWNASEYHRLSLPQFQWGQRVLSQLHLCGDELVLDAGCGSGKLAGLLAERLIRGRVVGVDLSRNMVAHARENLEPSFGQHVRFLAADMSALPFYGCFDGIFSTASFHWVRDHSTLFRSLYDALKPAGWLHAQCGGGTNLIRLRQRVRALSETSEFSNWLEKFEEPWFFADANTTADRLRHAGFVEVETGLERAPTTVATAAEFEDYLRTFILHRHLERFPDEALRHAFVRKLAEQSSSDDPPWTFDYWRLNLRAKKPRLPK